MSRHCCELHQIVNGMERIRFPFRNKIIPDNGLYILFEREELGHGGDRIVRIGTHTGEGQLRSRLYQHFLNENKDRSIFRKNIGRAILNKSNDSYLKLWELDLTTRKNKDKYLHMIDLDYQGKIEDVVTKYIQEMFSFVIIEENDKVKRLLLEKRITSDVSNCNECKSSKNWLGRYSTKEKIIDSGLWQVNELFKDGFTEDDFVEFKDKLIGNINN